MRKCITTFRFHPGGQSLTRYPRPSKDEKRREGKRLVPSFAPGGRRPEPGRGPPAPRPVCRATRSPARAAPYGLQGRLLPPRRAPVRSTGRSNRRRSCVPSGGSQPPLEASSRGHLRHPIKGFLEPVKPGNELTDAGLWACAQPRAPRARRREPFDVSVPLAPWAYVCGTITFSLLGRQAQVLRAAAVYQECHEGGSGSPRSISHVICRRRYQAL